MGLVGSEERSYLAGVLRCRLLEWEAIEMFAVRQYKRMMNKLLKCPKCKPLLADKDNITQNTDKLCDECRPYVLLFAGKVRKHVGDKRAKEILNMDIDKEVEKRG